MNVSSINVQKLRFSVDKIYFACQYLLPVINMLFDRPLWSFLTDEKKKSKFGHCEKKRRKIIFVEIVTVVVTFRRNSSDYSHNILRIFKP